MFVQKALLAELVPAVLDYAPQLASRAELCRFLVSRRTPLRSFAFAGLVLPQRALSAAAVMAAQAHALLSSPCLAQPRNLWPALCAELEQSVLARCGTQWEARLSPWKMRAAVLNA